MHFYTDFANAYSKSNTEDIYQSSSSSLFFSYFHNKIQRTLSPASFLMHKAILSFNSLKVLIEFIDPIPDDDKAVFLFPYSVFVFCSFRLLQSKPEVARKALSENSLLKNMDFNEKFLGEENVTESKL